MMWSLLVTGALALTSEPHDAHHDNALCDSSAALPEGASPSLLELDAASSCKYTGGDTWDVKLILDMMTTDACQAAIFTRIVSGPSAGQQLEAQFVLVLHQKITPPGMTKWEDLWDDVSVLARQAEEAAMDDATKLKMARVQQFVQLVLTDIPRTACEEKFVALRQQANQGKVTYEDVLLAMATPPCTAFHVEKDPKDAESGPAMKRFQQILHEFGGGEGHVGSTQDDAGGDLAERYKLCKTVQAAAEKYLGREFFPDGTLKDQDRGKRSLTKAALHYAGGIARGMKQYYKAQIEAKLAAERAAEKEEKAPADGEAGSTGWGARLKKLGTGLAAMTAAPARVGTVLGAAGGFQPFADAEEAAEVEEAAEAPTAVIVPANTRPDTRTDAEKKGAISERLARARNANRRTAGLPEDAAGDVTG